VTVAVTLGIGDSQPVMIILDPRLPSGPWQAQVTLRSGLLERQVAATITFPASGTGVAVPATAVRATRVRATWLYPVAAGLVLLLLSAAVGVLLVARRRRERTFEQHARAQLFRPVHRPAAAPVPYLLPTAPETIAVRPDRVQVHADLGITQARPGEDAAQVMLHANAVLAVATGSAPSLPEGQVDPAR
jgi:hypothetical protein